MKKPTTTLLFEKTFPTGPKIAVLFFPKKQEGTQVVLQKSNIFTSSFFVDFEPAFLQRILNWLSSYSKKKPAPVLQLPRQILPPFSEEVLNHLKKIPFGKTLSYGDLALLAGSSKAARAVGTICRLNSWPLFIPCHRVLPTKKGIGGYAFGSSIKQILLDFEKTF